MRNCERLHAEALEPRRLLSVAFDNTWGPHLDSGLVADMNGDGKADLVSTLPLNGSTDRLDVRLSNGDGSFSLVPGVFFGLHSGLRALGDFDGDGDIDAIVGSTLALNDGNGLLTQQTFDPELFGVDSCLAIDTDGDGRAELATKPSTGTTLRLLGLVDGAFTQLSSLEVDSRLWFDRSASVIDLTGDGRPELVLRTFSSRPDFTLLVFIESGVLRAGPQLADRAVLADVTRDGIADLYTFVITQPFAGTNVFISPGTGDGTFGAPQHRGRLFAGIPQVLEAPDLNGDGYPDLLYGPPKTRYINFVAMLSDSTGRYASGTVGSQSIPLDHLSGTGLGGVADFDGDGRLDLLTTHSQQGFLSTSISRQITGPSTASFAVSKTHILPQDSIVLSATVTPGDPDGSFSPYVAFYIDQDGDGLVSAGDTELGRAESPDPDGVYRYTYNRVGTVPMGAVTLLAIAGASPNSLTTSSPLSTPVTFLGLSLASFTVSDAEIRPLDPVVLSATVVHGDLGPGAHYVTFYRDTDGDGIVSAPDIAIGQVFAPDPDGVYRFSYRQVGGVPIGPAMLLAVTTLGTTTSAPLSSPVNFWTRLFFPEGFRNDATINEYLSMVNPQDHVVRYQLIARYETGERDQVIATGELAAFSRGGVTICERGVPDLGLTRPGVGYALELQTDGHVGATFAHYDSTFTSAAGPRASGGAGEALTSSPANRWSYAELSTANFDFLLFYNPTEVEASVTITFYDDDLGSVAYAMTIPALRRGGVALRDVGGLLPNRTYAAVVYSSVEVSAAHTRYRADGRAWSALAQGEAYTHLFPGVEYRPGAVATLSLFNSSAGAVDVTITTAYDIGETRTYTTLMLPRQRRSLDPFENAPPGATVVSVRLTDNSLRILSALSVDDASRGDITSSAPAAAARTVWAFGDAFLSRAGAGTNEFESLFIYNATDALQRVTVRFLFTDGTFADRSLDVRARAPARLALEDESVITDHAPNTWYGIMVYGEGMIVASLTHWDLSQGGGWSTLGTPQGLVGAV